MKILFSGGGTLGPVTPLLAVIEELRLQDDASAHQFLWIATERGVEIPLLRKAGVEVVTIPSGKFRRYVDFKNLSDLGNIVRGFFAARKIIREFKPDVVVTAGGFVSVPVHYAARFLGVPSLVHQQDLRIGLANKLMSWVARRVTVSVEAQRAEFSKLKTVYTGNPVRLSVLAGSRERAIELFRLNSDLATIFVFGGGTGSTNINRIIEQIARESSGQFQIIHLTGAQRTQSVVHDVPTYHPYPFFTGEMAHAYAAADIVVARAGFNTITEVAAWGKPSILIPIFGSHQTENALWAGERGATFVQDELALTPHDLLQELRDILNNAERYESMSVAASELFPVGARERLATEILAVGSGK